MQKKLMRLGLAALAAGILALPTTMAQAEEDYVEHRASEHEAPLFGTFKVDQVERRWVDGRDSVNWEAQGWAGGDTERLWFMTEGSKPNGGNLEEAEFQLLYSRMTSEFWDVQAGVRYDVRPQPGTAYGVVGVKGIAPYFFDVTAQAFVSEDGDVSGRMKAELDLLLTQKLILQPSAELNIAVQRVEALGVGRGVNDVGLGLRLRYEFVKEFAPYVGIQWDRKLGDTAEIARSEGERASQFSVVTGVRFWF